MAFTIPTQAAAYHVHMAELDQHDLVYIQEAMKGNGVMSGCAVTPQGSPDMTVAMAAGSVRTNDLTTHQVAAGNATITTADTTDPRIDIVVATQNGTVAVRAGTPATVPLHPSLTAGDVPLALVYVEANETAIEGSMIADKRLFPMGYVFVEKLADESVTSNITPQADDHIKFWIGANETWFIEIIMYEGSASDVPDMRWGATYPSGADIDFGIFGSRAHAAAADGLDHDILAKGDINGGTINLSGGESTSSNGTFTSICATVENGATAGLFTLQWAQNVSNAAALTMKRGSTLEAWKLVA